MRCRFASCFGPISLKAAAKLLQKADGYSEAAAVATPLSQPWAMTMGMVALAASGFLCVSHAVSAHAEARDANALRGRDAARLRLSEDLGERWILQYAVASARRLLCEDLLGEGQEDGLLPALLIEVLGPLLRAVLEPHTHAPECTQGLHGDEMWAFVADVV